MSTQLDQAEYEAIQAQILALATVVGDMPLEAFIAAIDHADTLGPILDPTLWMKAHKPMHEIRQLAAGLLTFKQVVDKLRLKYQPEGR